MVLLRSANRHSIQESRIRKGRVHSVSDLCFLLHSLATMMPIVIFVVAGTILLTITEHLSFLSPAICCGKFHQLKAADNIPPVGIRNLHDVVLASDYNCCYFKTKYATKT